MNEEELPVCWLYTTQSGNVEFAEQYDKDVDSFPVYRSGSSRLMEKLEAMRAERDEALKLCERLNLLVECHEETAIKISFQLDAIKREMKGKGYVFPERGAIWDGVGEWIDHDGRGPPIMNEDTLVHVKFRDGEFSDFGNPWPVVTWATNWWHGEKPCSGDIVAYKIVGGKNEQG